jgi:hypothetical protein
MNDPKAFSKRVLEVEAKMTSEQPDWIVQHQREKAAQDRKTEENQQRQLEAAKSVHERGAEFWQQLVDRLAFNAKAVEQGFFQTIDERLTAFALPEHDLTHTPDFSCHIQIDRLSVRNGPDSRQMLLYHRPGGNRIRRWYQRQELTDIELQAGPKGVAAVMDRNAPKTTQELADHIVRGMTNSVRA